MIQAGIIGLGNIAHRVAKGMQAAKNVRLYAAASRDIQKAEAFAKQHQITRAYGSYEELLRDESIDLVYICTPNYLHRDHILQALKHHKHVLCEKPLVSNQTQLKECFAYARKQRCFLMEAEKTLFTPLNQKLYGMVQEGAIGKLRYIEASYGYALHTDELPADFWGYRREDGGSAYDVGVYPICYANFFAQGNLCDVKLMQRVTEKGYDTFMQGLLVYENGVMASVRSSWEMDMENYGYLYGEKGYIVTKQFWKHTEAFLVKSGERTRIFAEMESDFTGEIEHAAQCILQGRLESGIMSEHASGEIMRVLEEIKKQDCMSKAIRVK